MSCQRIVVRRFTGAVAVIALAAAGVDWSDTGAARRSVRLDSYVPPAATVVTAEEAIERPTADSAGRGPNPQPNALVQIRAADTRRADLQAIAALADVAGQQAESILAAVALGHTEPAAREEAIHLLGERNGTLALQTLQLALQDPSPRVRDAAVQAFVAIGGDSAVLELSAALSAADLSLRLSAVDALGQIGGARAMGYLQQVLQDENDAIRTAAVEWLLELCDTRPQLACANGSPSEW